MSTWHCKQHSWWLEEDELCPVCDGVALERERIIKLLDSYTMYRFEKQWIVDLIEGTSSGTTSSAVENPQAGTAR